MKDLNKELEKIYTADQEVRDTWEKLLTKYSSDSPEVKKHLKLVNKIEKSNLKVIEKVISQYGWPSDAIIGYKANYAIWLVIQHSNKKIMQKYEKNMEAAYKAQKISNNDYAAYKDRLLLLQDKKQIYGTQYIYDEEIQKYVLDNSESIEIINKKRKEIHLPPLEDEK